jgi:hypothetical protein
MTVCGHNEWWRVSTQWVHHRAIKLVIAMAWFLDPRNRLKLGAVGTAK